MKFEMSEADFKLVRRALAMAYHHENNLAMEASKIMPAAHEGFIKAAMAIREIDTTLANQYAMMNKEERKS